MSTNTTNPSERTDSSRTTHQTVRASNSAKPVLIQIESIADAPSVTGRPSITELRFDVPHENEQSHDFQATEDESKRLTDNRPEPQRKPFITASKLHEGPWRRVLYQTGSTLLLFVVCMVLYRFFFGTREIADDQAELWQSPDIAFRADQDTPETPLAERTGDVAMDSNIDPTEDANRLVETTVPHPETNITEPVLIPPVDADTGLATALPDEQPPNEQQHRSELDTRPYLSEQTSLSGEGASPSAADLAVETPADLAVESEQRRPWGTSHERGGDWSDNRIASAPHGDGVGQSPNMNTNGTATSSSQPFADYASANQSPSPWTAPQSYPPNVHSPNGSAWNTGQPLPNGRPLGQSGAYASNNYSGRTAPSTPVSDPNLGYQQHPNVAAQAPHLTNRPAPPNTRAAVPKYPSTGMSSFTAPRNQTPNVRLAEQPGGWPAREAQGPRGSVQPNRSVNHRGSYYPDNQRSYGAPYNERYR